MLKVVCIQSCDEGAMYGDGAIEKNKLYYAHKWEQLASAGDHYSLVYGQPNTWSQKYNLVWDRVLGYNLFPKYIAQKEIEQKYGDRCWVESVEVFEHADNSAIYYP